MSEAALAETVSGSTRLSVSVDCRSLSPAAKYYWHVTDCRVCNVSKSGYTFVSQTVVKRLDHYHIWDQNIHVVSVTKSIGHKTYTMKEAYLRRFEILWHFVEVRYLTSIQGLLLPNQQGW